MKFIMKKVYCFAINWYLKTSKGLSISESAKDFKLTIH